VAHLFEDVGERRTKEKDNQEGEKMNLKEMVNTMMPSDRLIVKDTYGEELYRGYAANYDNTQKQALRAVQCHQISVDITKRMPEQKLTKRRPQGEPVPEGRVHEYKFKDLDMKIYTKITIA
jgi:hypothetical protein